MAHIYDGSGVRPRNMECGAVLDVHGVRGDVVVTIIRCDTQESTMRTLPHQSREALPSKTGPLKRTDQQERGTNRFADPALIC